MTYPKLSTAIALAIIAAAFMLSGCSAAFLERISTERFTGKETEPFVTERCVDCTPSRVGITKSLALNNPKPYEIEAFISCGSMYQADLTMTVKANTTKWQFVGANNNQGQFQQSCFLMEWKRTTPEVADVR
jgi:PBP1b-binding outer membrane lipoprotein LpoB